MISMDKTYRQRNGRKFIVGAIRTDGVDPDNAVIGWGEEETGAVVAATRRIDGSYPHSAASIYFDPSQYDLIEVVPDVVRWVNVYSTAADGIVHMTREEADRYSNMIQGRIAILKITTKNGGVNGAEDVSVERTGVV